MTAPKLAGLCLALGIIGVPAAASAQQDPQTPVTLTFSRTGTDAASVSVSLEGAPGATASLTSLTPEPLAAFGQTALCANVNANTGPTIVYEFSVSGLPADFSFNTVGLTTHAFNNAGGNQQNNDGKLRHYNVAVAAQGNPFGSLTDIDLAADAVNGTKQWTVTAPEALSPADGNLSLTLTVTKGTTNLGCFFGLESLTLSTVTAVEPVEPVEPIQPGEGGKVYTISWQTSAQKYITESASGALTVEPYAVNKMQFWEFIPTDKENCYYIRNTASGNYIGSCNLTPASASKIHVSPTPVEYYVGHTAATAQIINGCVWLSSTDCANHDNESNSARCLNKDGASETVITWTNGTAKTGSYWTMTETGNLYEPRPFTPSAAVGSPAVYYHIFSPEGLSLSADGSWLPVAETESQRWYFVGTGNATGGYQIVAAQGHSPLNSGETYKIESAGARFRFVNAEGTPLEINGVSEFTFPAARSEFALKNQIYKIPCGSLGNVHITSVTIGNGFRYPMATVSNGSVSYPMAARPSNKYVILSRDAASLTPGENEVEITLSAAPASGTTLTLFLDWNRDGVFEQAQPLEAAAQVKTVITVPADAPRGLSRARLRLTDNGLSGADDDVNGQILDLRLNVIDPSDAVVDPQVTVNDPKRGTAAWTDGTASATPLGNSLFLYWLDGVRIGATTASWQPSPSSQPRTLTAVFSPNTDLNPSESALAAIELSRGAITLAGSLLKVNSDAQVIRILLFGVNGNLVASTSGSDSLDCSTLTPGIYIAKAITANGTLTSKIKI